MHRFLLAIAPRARPFLNCIRLQPLGEMTLGESEPPQPAFTLSLFWVLLTSFLRRGWLSFEGIWFEGPEGFI
jgi:hypothetical protein